MDIAEESGMRMQDMEGKRRECALSGRMKEGAGGGKEQNDRVWFDAASVRETGACLKSASFEPLCAWV